MREKISIHNYSLRGCHLLKKELRTEFVSLLLSKKLLNNNGGGEGCQIPYFNYLKTEQSTHIQGCHICHLPFTAGVPFPLPGYSFLLTLKFVYVCMNKTTACSLWLGSKGTLNTFQGTVLHFFILDFETQSLAKSMFSQESCS